MIEKVLQLWLGKLDSDGLADDAHRSLWYKKDPEFDTMLRDQFLSVYEDVSGGQCESWLESARGTIAYTIVIDQFSRNMFRDTSKMYDADLQAQRICKEAIDEGRDKQLGTDERIFLRMPLMHSEDLLVQEFGVAQFKQVADQCPDVAKERCLSTVQYAEAHRDIVARFQRFPHRNEILGRKSTDEEVEFLQQPGSSF